MRKKGISTIKTLKLWRNNISKSHHEFQGNNGLIPIIYKEIMDLSLLSTNFKEIMDLSLLSNETSAQYTPLQVEDFKHVLIGNPKRGFKTNPLLQIADMYLLSQPLVKTMHFSARL
jgi:hypothetical protein